MDGGLTKAPLGRIGPSFQQSQDRQVSANTNCSSVTVISNTDENVDSRRRASSHDDEQVNANLQKEISKLSSANSSYSEKVDALTLELEKEQKVRFYLNKSLICCKNSLMDEHLQKNQVLTASQNLLQTQLSTARYEIRAVLVLFYVS